MPVVVFCMFFTSHEINIKQSPNATKLYGDFLWTKRHVMGPGCACGVLRGEHNPPGRAWAPRLALVGCAPLEALLWYFFSTSCVFWSRKIHKKFHCIWTPFGIYFLRCQKHGKITIGTWHYVNRLVPKNDIK